MQNAFKIAVSLPKKDYEEMEQTRHKLGLGRSLAVDKAIRFWLDGLKKRELTFKYEKAYRKKPEKIKDLKAWEIAGTEILDSGEDWS